MSSKVYVTIIRPANCLIASAAVVIAGLVAVGYSVLELGRLIDLLLASLVVFLFVGAGNTLNDYFDYEVDRINHPERPIPSGLIARRNAMTYAIILFLPTFVLALLVGVESFLVVLISGAVMASYERRLKRRGFLGNLQISWLVALLFLFGGLAVYEGDAKILARVAALSVMAFLATLGREITKDIEDVRGDRNRTTLPMSVGVRNSAYIAQLFYAAAVVVSLIVFHLGVLGRFYLWSVLVADAVFLVSAVSVFRNPTMSSRLSKVAMVLALLAFLLGVLVV
ncbi:MAG: UbiA family prenyltransferase [Thermoplasmata archaeon]